MVIDLLHSRASVRKFTSERVSNEIILTMLEAARISPSGGNEQSWLFGLVTDRDLIEKISGLAYQQTWITSAPLIIVLCTIIVSDERGGRNIQKKRFPSMATAIDKIDKRLYSALNMEEHQTKIAGTQLALAALEHGVHSTWVSYFDVEKLAELLHLPEHIVPSELMVMGYPADTPRMASKKSIGKVFFGNYYR